MSSKRKRYLKIGILSLVLGLLQAYFVHTDYLTLKQRGQLAHIFNVDLRDSPIGAGESVSYSFKTSTGLIVSGSERTRQDRDYYENLTVIYDPHNPAAFEKLPDFERYSVIWTAVFFGILFPVFVTLILGGLADMWFGSEPTQ